MKKLALTVLFLFGAISLSWSQIVDISPSGHTLRYSKCPGSYIENYGVTVNDAYILYLFGGDNLTGDLIIPDSVTYEGSTYPVKVIVNYALENSSITSVSLPNTLSIIDFCAFKDCHELASVSIPNSVIHIGHEAFQNCYSLCGLLVPNSVTTIEGNAFLYVKSVEYHGTASTSQFGALCVNGYNEGPFTFRDSTKTYLAACCPSASGEITIPNTVNTIGPRAFMHCRNLTGRLIIPNSVNTIESYAFNGCTGFSGNLDIPNSVNTIKGDAFRGCTGFSGTLNLPNSIDTIYGGVFQRCTGFSGTLYFPDSISYIGYHAFDSCIGFSSVSIPSSMTFISARAFYNCTGLNAVYYRGTVEDWCRINFDASLSTGSFNYSNPLYYAHNLYIDSVLLTDLSVSYLNYPSNGLYMFEEYAFINATCLRSITLPSDHRMYIGYQTFAGCTGVTEISHMHSGYIYGQSDSFDSVPTDIPVYIPCGKTSQFANHACWSRFTNFIEVFDYSFSARSADESMGSVEVIISPDCSTNQQAEISATSSWGFQFSHWSDGNTSSQRTLTVTSDTELIAYFIPSENAPSITSVITDQNGHNVVRWAPRDVLAVDHYNIYREDNGVFAVVGTVPHDGSSEYSWVDDQANTATQSYLYSISEVFFDNRESDPSAPHTSMNVQLDMAQGNVCNLSWNPYIGFNYDSYSIYRGNSIDNMELIAVLDTSTTTYNDPYTSGSTVYYQVEVSDSTDAKVLKAASQSNIVSTIQRSSFNIQVTSYNPFCGTVQGGGTYPAGSFASISATSNNGFPFSHWSDGSTEPSRSVIVNADASYVAYFKIDSSIQYTIHVVSNNPDMGEAFGSGTFPYGSYANISAEAHDGFVFDHWSDGSTDPFHTITITRDETYTAYFHAFGIDDINISNTNISTRGREIIISGANDNNVIVYDVLGRTLYHGTALLPICVPSKGIYMVKIGDAKPQKVLVKE
jgi:hypothetical protein